MAIYQLGDRVPEVHDTAWVFESAAIIGHVRLAAGANIWPGVTIRGDNEWIEVGENSNVQENCVLHTDPGCPLTIGANVTVGHQAMLHGCTIGDGSLIGIQAVVLNGAKIGRNCLIGAGALITEGKEIPDNSLVVGSPGKVIRTLDEAAIARMHLNTANYVERARACRSDLRRIA
ncbi:MAG: gamma carbonic anhydrase family protein [Burkholderiaceae bacterium]